MNGRTNSHGQFIGVLPRDLLVHVKQVAVFFAHSILSVPGDGIFEIQIDRQLSVADSVIHLTPFLCRARGHVAWNQITKGRITTFEAVITVCFRNVGRMASVPGQHRNPHTSVIWLALAHKREFRLRVAAHRSAGGMNLGVTRNCEPDPSFVAAPCRRDVAPFGIGRQIKHVSVLAGTEDHSVRRVSFQTPRRQVAHDDFPGDSIDKYISQASHVGRRPRLCPAGFVSSWPDTHPAADRSDSRNVRQYDRWKIPNPTDSVQGHARSGRGPQPAKDGTGSR